MKFNLVFLCFVLTSCVGQPPVPIEYNHEKSSSNKSLPRPNLIENNKEILDNNVEEIVSIPLNQQEKDLTPPTGYLVDSQVNKPSTSNQDDIITVPPITPDNRKLIYHQVQTGETLASIAGDYNQTIEELSELNNILPPYNLQKSQMLKIKVSNELLNKKNKEHNLKNIAENLHLQEQQTPLQTILPKFIKPVAGKIIAKFGDSTTYGENKGINIEATEGDKVYSIASGKVVYVGSNKQFGNLLIIKLDVGDLYVAYAHLADLLFKKGSIIRQGEVIGHVGRTGNINSAQLHLAIREGKTAVDPLKYIEL